MQCGKANSSWVVLIKICISFSSFPGKVSASCLILLAGSLVYMNSFIALFFLL